MLEVWKYIEKSLHILVLQGVNIRLPYFLCSYFCVLVLPLGPSFPGLQQMHLWPLISLLIIIEESWTVNHLVSGHWQQSNKYCQERGGIISPLILHCCLGKEHIITTESHYHHWPPRGRWNGRRLVVPSVLHWTTTERRQFQIHRLKTQTFYTFVTNTKTYIT